MNIIGFNDKEFKEAILNNIENKENLDKELLDKVIEFEVDGLAERIANHYDLTIEDYNRRTYLEEYYKTHMVNKEDYDYLGLDDDENKILVRIDNVEEQDYKGKVYVYDYLIYVDSTDVDDWGNVFAKFSGKDMEFEEVEIDTRTWQTLEFNMIYKNNN
ncbi:hypothetical protein [Clostridium botulinum]|uniref:hypothetical protein n=1 Tax=Clostridium botulinum TaxID=1491 RepID=UPI001E30A100|nr:hypothetical protein [Clostridium botulinum]MCD3254372.1 hypothetical protein [Clostridium botulinum C/D]MCD3279872.1 hypothetical protein [Clostridium botulinum C/D]MCD3339603.1 hypothetical protein [Clostridium botulinum C/D]MCD3357511.1 hypothetical protein [Clostridium botulinum C/D]